jgi:hypothetical protein
MIIPFATLSILLSAAIMLLVTEEFLFPVGFVEWYNRLVPPKIFLTEQNCQSICCLSQTFIRPSPDLFAGNLHTFTLI